MIKTINCDKCGLDLNGWVYFEFEEFVFCKFCYNSFEIRGVDE